MAQVLPDRLMSVVCDPQHGRPFSSLTLINAHIRRHDTYHSAFEDFTDVTEFTPDWLEESAEAPFAHFA
jgi:hypothetical protein